MAIKNLRQFQDHPTLKDSPALQRVLAIFNDISSIPRPSEREAAVREHLIGLAQTQGWEVKQDSEGNIAFNVPAKTDKEEAMPIILQAHMDIVTTPGVDDDLGRTAEIVDKGNTGDEKGLWMQTEGQSMTLGADNGIGLALAIGAMLDPDLEHGPVTILATVNEETGMTGAQRLDPSILPEKAIMINLDAEEGAEYICIGCAGSTDIVAKFPLEEREQLPQDFACVDIALTGFPGGHSGVGIHEGNGNAIQSLGGLLKQIEAEIPDLRLISIDGGTVRNAIPADARATIAVPEASKAKLQEISARFVEAIQNGTNETVAVNTDQLLPSKADDVEVSIEDSETDVHAMTVDFQNRLLAAITETPTGPFAESDLPHVGRLVTLSNNLGTVNTNQDDVTIISMARGADVVELRAKMDDISALYHSQGAEVKCDEPSSGWLEDPDTSPAVAKAIDAVRTVVGSFKVMAYHAGLEAGIVSAKIPEVSAVAVGPVIRGAHKPTERVDLQSVATQAQVLKVMLEAA